MGWENKLHTQIIQIPYDSGVANVRMGQGPARLVDVGLRELTGGFIHLDRVETEDDSPREIGTTFQVVRALADMVRLAVENGRFPLVLAGNCMSCVGTLAGMGVPRPGIIWLDGHGDFNTPETTESGLLDGMALATAVGRCWQNLASGVSGFGPVAEKNVILVGAREIDPAERFLLEKSQLTVIDCSTIKRESGTALTKAIQKLRASTPRVYLHVDLDVLDPTEARANQFAPAGGLSVEDVENVIRLTHEEISIGAAAITAYDPSCDQNGNALKAGARLMSLLIDFVSQGSKCAASS